MGKKGSPGKGRRRGVGLRLGTKGEERSGDPHSWVGAGRLEIHASWVGAGCENVFVECGWGRIRGGYSPISKPTRASAFRVPLRQAATLVSLSHSLLSRVAATRAARGDAAAAARARRIASLLSSRGAWGLGWDYIRHYAFSSATGCGLSCVAAASRLLAAAAEASRLRSATDAAQWMRNHYGDVRDAAALLLNGLLDAFSEQGPLREVVMDVKWEVEEGELLKDCLEVGAKDLQGLLVIAKDLFAGATRTSSQHSEL